MGGPPRTGRLRAATAALVAVLALAPGAVAQDDVPFIDWTPLLPSVATEYRPSQEKDCIDGDDRCIDETIAEMYRRFNVVIPRCDHRAVFSLTYIRVTEDIRRALNENFYEEPRFLQHEDRVFARMYFEALDNYAAVRREYEPPAWRVALDAGAKREVTAVGDLLLSMNAHINRDMPFMLAALGMVKPDGSSRKPDHDRYNRRLAALYKPVIQEIAQRFDPTADDVDAGPGDDAFAAGTLQSWREGAWRNAERLVAARTEVDRRAVADSIEEYARNLGEQIRQGTLYRGGQDSSARDAWCARFGGQDPEAGSRPAALGKASLGPPPRALKLGRDGRVRVMVRCPAGGRACLGSVQLDWPRPRGTRRLGRSAYELAPGGRRALRIRLSRSAAAAVRRAGSARVRATVRRTGVEGRRAVARWTVTLR